MLAEALTFVWNVSNNGPPKKRKYKPRAAAKERMVAVRFEQMPRVSVPELDHAYNMGLITWEAYRRLMSTFCGMAPEDMTTSAEPWSKAEKLSLMGSTDELKSEFKKGKDGVGI